ncbi:MAG: hypothetical protein R3F20_00125 [Planctomycetota bacterium]
MVRLLSLFLLATAGSSLHAQAVPWGLPVVVENPTAVARTADRATVSLVVPQAYGSLDPQADFHLVDDQGTPVPAQMRALSRWFAKRDDTKAPVKWVQTIFLADVPALGQRTYYLRTGTGPGGALVATSSASAVTVSTGAAVFTVPRNGDAVLGTVTLSGAAQLASPARFAFEQVDGTPAPMSVLGAVVERAGTLETVVRQWGEIVGLGLRFTARLRFVVGSAEVEIDYRLENPGGYGLVSQTGASVETQHFKSASLLIPLASAPNAVVEDTGSLPLPAGASWALRQDFLAPVAALPWLNGFMVERDGPLGVSFSVAERHPGAIALARAGGSLAIAVDRFWQNAPKAFRRSGSNAIVDLWPSFGAGPTYGGPYGGASTPNIDPLALSSYRFEGGRWKTHRLRLAFKTGSAHTPNQLVSLAERVRVPLVGHGPLGWNFRLGGFGEAVIESRAWPDVGGQRLERFQGIFARDDAADGYGIYPPIGLDGFRRRGGTYGGQQMYGWENFGDIAWDDGYCSLHYDIPATLMLGWFRTGDPAFLDVGRDLVWHRRDYDQLHTTDPSAQRRGGQFYEKGYHHGNFTAPAVTHNWVEGLLLHYLATGDEGSREAALECGEFVLRQHLENWNGWWGARMPGWALEALVHLWNHVGDAQYLVGADGIVDAWNAAEAANGSMGYVINPGYWGMPHAQSWMHGIMLGALGKYYISTGDADALVTMDRVATWFLTDVVETLPSGPSNQRTLARVWERLAPGYQADLSRHHVWSIVHGLSYAALCLNDLVYLGAADSLFQSATRYWQESAGTTAPQNWNDPQTWDPITWKPAQFPTTETKALGNIGLWGLALPAVRTYLTGQW